MSTLHRLSFVLLMIALATGCRASGRATVTSGPGPGPGPGPVGPGPEPAGPASCSSQEFLNDGWTCLGQHTVGGGRDRDMIRVGRYEGRFDKLAMVVYDSDLELDDFIVVFANGERFSPQLRAKFKEGERSRKIDLPGADRVITGIELVYKNLPGGGRARVEVYGIDSKNQGRGRPGGGPTGAIEPGRPGGPPPGPPPAPVADIFDANGWTLLGSQSVTGKKDTDVFRVGKGKGKFDKITINVKDSDLELVDFVITFENGQKFEPKLRHAFKEGSRSRGVDLPNADRYIKDIKVKYANLPGGGAAKVEIYGKDTKQTRADATSEPAKDAAMTKKAAKKDAKMEKKKAEKAAP